MPWRALDINKCCVNFPVCSTKVVYFVNVTNLGLGVSTIHRWQQYFYNLSLCCRSIGQLRHIYVATPSIETLHVTILPKIQPAPVPCPLFQPTHDFIRLPPNGVWVIRLPYPYHYHNYLNDAEVVQLVHITIDFLLSSPASWSNRTTLLSTALTIGSRIEYQSMISLRKWSWY